MTLDFVQPGAAQVRQGLIGGVSNATKLGAGFSSSRLQVASNPSLQTGNIDFTAGCWVYPNSLSAAFTIMGKFDTGTSQREWRILYNNGTQFFNIIVTSDGTSSTSQPAWNASTTPQRWYFVVIWHDSVNNQLAIQIDNGTVSALNYSAGVFSGTNAFTMGSLVNAGQALDGRIDSAFFSKEVVSATELTWLYNAGNGRTWGDVVSRSSFNTASLISWWDLNQTAAAVRLDAKTGNNLSVAAGTVSQVVGVASGVEYVP